MLQTLNRKQKGFTLIELLVVIAIIGLLASIVLISLQAPQGKARDSRRLAEVKQIASLLDQFNVDCVGFPVTGGPVLIGSAGSNRTTLYKNSATECGTDLTGAGTNGGFGTLTTNPGTLISRIPVPPTATGIAACSNANNVLGGTLNLTSSYGYVPTDAADTAVNAAATGKAANFRVYFCVEQSVSNITTTGPHYWSSLTGLN